MKKLLFISALLFIFPAIAHAQNCFINSITGNHSGINGTTHSQAVDNNSSTFFESSHDNWQYIQIGFSCDIDFKGLRRNMTKVSSSGFTTRAFQGEGVQYSLDGQNWTSLTGPTSTGWEPYVNYNPPTLTAWRDLPYGTSTTIRPTSMVRAKFIRYQWDGNFDRLNEVTVDFIQLVAPTITSNPVTSVPNNSTYRYDVNANGSPDIQYSLLSSPSGMSIGSTSGEIFWESAVTGNHTITVEADNGVGSPATQTYTLEVTQPPFITSNAPNSVNAGSNYNYDVNANGNPSPTFSLTAAPSGMSINSSSGQISWTPNSIGSFNVTVQASNRVGSNSQSFTVNVTGVAPTITTGAPSGTIIVGNLFTYDVNASGNPGQTFSLDSAPQGMTIDAGSGVIRWTPTTTGTFSGVIRATNGVNPDATQSFTLTVTGVAPSITSSAVTSATVGQTYTYDVNANGNPSPTYALTTSPSGMTINASNGIISWMPGSVGTFNVAVEASNSVGDASQQFSVTVSEPPLIPSITSNPITSGMVGAEYTYDVEAVANPNPSFSLVAAPPGMTIDASTGVISWTPPSVGTFEVTVRAANSQGSQDQNFSITVSAELVAPSFTSNPVEEASLNSLYTYNVNANGNPSPTYSLSASPQGMTIDANSGLIQWTPTETGDVSVTVVASNGVEPSATQTFMINVNFVNNQEQVAPTITSSPVTLVRVNESYIYRVTADGTPAPTFELAQSPDDMMIDQQTGEINWTPSMAGNFAVTVVASNLVAPADSQAFIIEVVPPVGVSTEDLRESALPERVELAQNHPNPFTNSTTIGYHLPEAVHVEIGVYDMLGRLVKVLETSHQPAGQNQLRWDGRDQYGSTLPAGIYYVRVQTDTGEQRVRAITKVQ